MFRLTAAQSAAVLSVFWFTAIGAALLALWFTWRNGGGRSRGEV